MKLLGFAALVVALVSAQRSSCDSDEYWSYNWRSCMPGKKVGQYCNAVQTCSSANNCVDKKCLTACGTSMTTKPKGNANDLCVSDEECTTGLSCSDQKCAVPAQATSPTTEPIVIEIEAKSGGAPITNAIDFFKMGESAVDEEIQTYMWGQVNNSFWGGRHIFDKGEAQLMSHLGKFASQYDLTGKGVQFTTRVYGDISADVEALLTSFGWSWRKLESTGFARHPDDVKPIADADWSCVCGTVHADMVAEPDWNVWKQGWIDLNPPALARTDIHAYHYGLDGDNFIINYFECYTGGGAGGMERDAADVLAQDVHAKLGFFGYRFTFGLTNAGTSDTFAMYGKYIPDDWVFHAGPNAGFVINPTEIAHPL